MSDEADCANDKAEFFRRNEIRRAQKALAGVARETCIDCNGPIPEKRRMAVPAVQRCTPCQEEFERGS